MSRGWVYKAGLWNVICDRCSLQVKSNEIRREWTGSLVCPSCYETRHPQDFLKVRQDRIAVPFSRPDPEETYVAVSYITIYVDDGYVAADYFEEL